MQFTYAYEGQPRVSLVIDIPKTKKMEIEAKRVWEVRRDLQLMMANITAESKANPQAFATQIFKTVKANFDTIVLVAVFFTIKHEGAGETMMTYTVNDVDLSK